LPAHEAREDTALITHALREAGHIARKFFGGTYKAWQKSVGNPVTEADIAIDAFLKETLLAARPDYGWLSEETADDKTRLERARTFIVDPIDGRMPPFTAQGQARRERNAARRMAAAAGPEDRSLQERCITYGSPQLTAGYQSYYQVHQTPTEVAFLTEMIHDTRLIHLESTPHVAPAIRGWLGDSRGHWEGDTLVVDTTNYRDEAFMGISTEQLHVTERFSRADADTLKYEVTINDPGTWTKPWSYMTLWKRSPKPVFEYACHEGNIGLEGILAGARADERAAAAKK